MDAVVVLVQQNYHLIIEAGLAIIILIVLFHKSYKLKETKEQLSADEVEQLISEWKPKPLVEEERLKEARESFIAVNKKDSDVPVFNSGMGPHVTLAGDGDGEAGQQVDYLNFASTGFLNYQTNESVITAAVSTLRSNGVGSCGPRGFYGTVDVHMNLEEKIAKFMKTEEAVLYSSGFATVASVIPAFAKTGDYVIVDKGVSLEVQVGVHLSRSKTHYFNHNDMRDLKRILQALQSDNIFDGTHRVFVIIEGLYIHHADVAPLPEIMALKNEYPFRLIIDESFSVGVLGAHGRGITEHFGVDVADVEIIAASVGNSIGSIGGFSCGDKQVCAHQRLNSSGYVFSCSLPPYLASAAIQSITLLEAGAEIRMLHDLVDKLWTALPQQIKALDVLGKSPSPFAHFRLKKSSGNRRHDEQILQEIVDKVRTSGRIILTRAKYVKQERFMPEPSIRFAISAHHTPQEITDSLKTINKIAESVQNSAF